MATEAAKVEAAPAAEAPKKKSKKLLFGVIALVLVGGGVGGWMALKPKPGAADGADKAEKTKPPAAPIYYKFDPAFVVNFGGEGSARYLQVTVEAMSRDPAVLEVLKNNEPAVRNDLVMLFSSQDNATLLICRGQGEAARSRRSRLFARCSTSEGGDGKLIENVYFTSFVIQYMGAEILNQDEIDALIKGVDDGAVTTEAPPDPGVARSLRSGDPDSHGARPHADAGDDQRSLCAPVPHWPVQHAATHAGDRVAPVRCMKFSEYTQNLHVPSSLNLIKLEPLRGTALMVLDAKLVFAIVDNFFGGNGRYAKIEGREFTADRRTHHSDGAAPGVRGPDARPGASAARSSIEYLSSEINPHFANIVSPSEIVVVSSFKIELDGGGGELHVTHAVLDDRADPRSCSTPACRASAWSAMRAGPARCARRSRRPRSSWCRCSGTRTLTLGRLVDLKPGDVIPCDFDGNVTLYAEGVPVRARQLRRLARPAGRQGRAAVSRRKQPY